MAQAFIALGSNVGDRAANLSAAIAMLDAEPRIEIIRVADTIETVAVDSPPGAGDFLNAVAELSTTIVGPRELLVMLLMIEKQLGRKRTIRNAPRTIDLDLLLFDDWKRSTGRLTLPHPRLHERRFVLAPLASIAPHVVHPTLRRTMSQLLADLDARGA